MATTFLLIRHASHDWIGKGLAGRLDGVGLNEQGKEECGRLAERLRRAGIDRMFVSPSTRARETAEPVARALGVAQSVHENLDEIDFGAWTGQSFEALALDPVWRVWCDRKSASMPPNGETIAAAEARMVECMNALHEAHRGEVLALFTHGDMIKAAIAHALKMSLDDIDRLDIAPASISELAKDDGWVQVRRVNDTGGFAP